MGDVDSGKTSFALKCLRRLAPAAGRAAMVDCDVGQSSVGPPCCVGMYLLEEDIPLPEERPLPPYTLHFVGDTTPEGNVPLFLAACWEALTQAIQRGAYAAVVDTTGLVKGEAGAMLKTAKIAMMKPRHTVVFLKPERETMLKNLARPFSECTTVHFLPSPPEVRSRDKQERAAHRLEAFSRYFRGSRVVSFPSEYLLRHPFVPRKGSVVGLMGRAFNTLDVGVIVEEDNGDVHILSPIDELGRTAVRTVRPGRIVLDVDTFLEEGEFRSETRM